MVNRFGCYCFLSVDLLAGGQSFAAGKTEAELLPDICFSYQKIGGFWHELDVVRRDPADIIRVGGTYYIWYSKVKNGPGSRYPSGYAATVWYATSSDGFSWIERGEAAGKGGHEVLARPHGPGVSALIGKVGPQQIKKTIRYAADGIDFKPVANVMDPPWGAAGIGPMRIPLRPGRNPCIGGFQ